MNTNSGHPSQADPKAPQPEPERLEARGPESPGATSEIEHAIERAGARSMATLRALSEELTQRRGPARNGGGAPPAPAEWARPGQGAAPRAAEPELPAPVAEPPPLAAQPRPPQQQSQAAGAEVPPRGGGNRKVRWTRRVLPVVLAALVLVIGFTALVSRQRPSVIESVAPTVGAVERPTAGPTAATSVAVAVDPLPATATPGNQGGGAVLPSATPAVAPTAAAPAANTSTNLAVAPTATVPAASTTARPAAGLTATAPAPSATAPSAAAVLQRARANEDAVRTGRFEATLNYGNGNRSAVAARFDLGGAGRVPRLQLATTSQRPGGSQTVEFIAIGERTWKREANGPWEATANQDGLWEQLRSFLPHTATAANPTVSTSGNTATLRWNDAERGAPVVLEVDAVTGAPRQLRQEPQGTGLEMTVTYHDWNVPVDISAPNVP